MRGHQEGAESVRALVRVCRKIGIKYLTLYTFSLENWIRPAEEIKGLMTLLRTYLKNQAYELHENKIRLRAIGRLDNLPDEARKALEEVMEATMNYTEGVLTLAISYGGRAEIIDGIKQIARKVKDGDLDVESIDEAMMSAHMYAPDIPDPDLLVRTSGEMRISNFLLWQISYSELYVTNVLWPDFREKEFNKALEEYSKRQRRFGDIK